MNTAPSRLQLKIGGMACSFCASSITKGLGRMPGILNANVSLAHEEALIEYDPERISEQQIKSTLLDLGYTIRDPRRVKAFEEQQREIDLERHRLVTAIVLTGLALLQMGLMWFGWMPTAVLQPVMTVAMPVIAVTTVFGPGLYILRMAWHSLRRGILNQHVLLEFGAFSGLVGGALGLVGRYGHVASLSFPIADFFAVATFITTYHILSGYTSLVVRTKASRAVMNLLALQPVTAVVIRAGQEQEVQIDQVAVGEHVRIRPGESIPLDGWVIDGRSDVDESLVTGESLPVEKQSGHEVIGGSINLNGSLLVEVRHVGEESFLQQVARQIEEARARKPGLLQLVDRVLAFYVPGVLAAAAVTLLVWTVGAALVTGHVEVSRGIFAMLAVFVMGYPCALGMATPLAMIRGGAVAAEHGILVRSGEAFQSLDRVDRVLLDKTGTLTQGRPSVTKVLAVSGHHENDVLTAAAALEVLSEHPLAQAVVNHAKKRGLVIPTTSEFRAVPGKGVAAQLAGAAMWVGSPHFLSEEGHDLSELMAQIEPLQQEGSTVIVVGKERQVIGLLAIADTLKPDALGAVRRLRALGIEPIMITGDNVHTALAIAAKVGIQDVRAELLPQDKALEVQKLQQAGHRVLMVGDGINDAPALTQADIGAAIGAGTDIAIESADVVLMGQRLDAVAEAIEIGHNATRKTKQNVALAFAFNGVGIPLAMTGLVRPAWAMLAMAASVSVVLGNSFLRGRPKALAGVPGASVTELVLCVPSMHCEGCLLQVTESVKHMDGVMEVTGDLADRVVAVRYSPSLTDRVSIETAIRQAGHVTEDPIGARSTTDAAQK